VNLARRVTQSGAEQTRGFETFQRLIRLRDNINARIHEHLDDRNILEMRGRLSMLQPDLEDIVIPAVPVVPVVPAVPYVDYYDDAAVDYDDYYDDDYDDVSGNSGIVYDDVDDVPYYPKVVTLSFDTANIGEAMLYGIEPTECPICYDNACDVTTGCGHGFCRVCVQSQFLASQAHPSCALCRQEMRELSSTSGRTLACLEDFMESANIIARMLY
jgi:hypothetical protein